MTWLNPAALAGLLALAVPIVVHLFGRRSARRQRFPTLRLLRLSHPTPATRSRPSDVLLLVVRCAVILSAVLALAQPLWSSRGRSRDARIPARAILVDTSASMGRRTSGGPAALERARLLARQMLDSAREGLIFETDRPGANAAGAASWLAGRSGLRELIIISDFQHGEVDDGHLAAIPAGIGVTLLRIDSVVPDIGSPGRVAVASTGNVVAEPQPHRTVATWAARASPPSLPVEVLVSDEDSAEVRVMTQAVSVAGPGSNGSSHRVLVVFPGYDSASALAAQVGPLTESWQGDLMLALRRDALLASTISKAELTDACEGRGPSIAVNGMQQAVATIAASQREPVAAVFSCADAGSLAGTALLAAVSSAMAPSAPLDEREPLAVPDEVLRAWERPATELAPHGNEETSPDGRWLWLMAIVLFLLEEWLRRRTVRPAVGSAAEVRHERVA